MSDIAPTATLTDLLPVLTLAFGTGGVTQLTRQLAKPTAPRARTTIALTIAAGLAALTVVALLNASLKANADPALLLAASCISGWTGPSLLSRLGSLIERRLGLGTQASVFDEK